MTDLELLVRDKYEGDAAKVTGEDKERLACGEPLAYVIGWLPFLGLHIDLSSHPLIPRPETEWWTEQLISHLKERSDDQPFRFLDLCAGSGAIGLAVLKHLPNSYVSFGEVIPGHCKQIRKNIELNGLDTTRADVRESDLFESFSESTAQGFDIIATNPPYIPEERTLQEGVTAHEPHEALFSGKDGLDIIRRIIEEAPKHLCGGGELWMECDISNIEKAKELVEKGAAPEAHSGAASPRPSEIRTDPYGRQRVLVSYFG